MNKGAEVAELGHKFDTLQLEIDDLDRQIKELEEQAEHLRQQQHETRKTILRKMGVAVVAHGRDQRLREAVDVVERAGVIVKAALVASKLGISYAAASGRLNRAVSGGLIKKVGRGRFAGLGTRGPAPDSSQG